MSKVTLELFKIAIDELRDMKNDYRKIKSEYESKEFHILTNTDFKAIYDQNNDKIRKGHIQKEIGNLYNKKEFLKDKIEYQEHLVEYYNGLIKEELL